MPSASGFEHNQDLGQKHVAGNSRRVLSDSAENGDHGAILKEIHLTRSSEESLGPRAASRAEDQGPGLPVPSDGDKHLEDSALSQSSHFSNSLKNFLAAGSMLDMTEEARSFSSSVKQVVRQGHLLVEGFNSTWQNRWAVLYGDRLEYSDSPGERAVDFIHLIDIHSVRHGQKRRSRSYRNSSLLKDHSTISLLSSSESRHSPSKLSSAEKHDKQTHLDIIIKMRSNVDEEGSKMLSHTESPEETPTSKGEHGCMSRLQKCLGIFPQSAYSGENVFVMRARTVQERDDWIRLIRTTAAIAMHAEPISRKDTRFRRATRRFKTLIRPYQSLARRLYLADKTQILLASVIALNFLLTAVEAEVNQHEEGEFAHTFAAINIAFTCFFTAELIVNMFANFWSKFWADIWNWGDFLIVIFSFLSHAANLPGVNILRVVRALRVCRLFKRLPSLRRMIVALSSSILPVFHAFGVLLLVTSVYSVLGVTFFSHIVVTGGTVDNIRYFGSFTSGLFTMFQTLTGDGWASEIARPVMQQNVWSSLFFVSYILIAGMVLTNVMVAVLLEEFANAGRQQALEEQDKANVHCSPLMERVCAPLWQCSTHEEQEAFFQELWMSMDQDQNGVLDMGELRRGLRSTMSADDEYKDVTPMELDEITLQGQLCDEDGNMSYDGFRAMLKRHMTKQQLDMLEGNNSIDNQFVAQFVATQSTKDKKKTNSNLLSKVVKNLSFPKAFQTGNGPSSLDQKVGGSPIRTNQVQSMPSPVEAIKSEAAIRRTSSYFHAKELLDSGHISGAGRMEKLASPLMGGLFFNERSHVVHQGTAGGDQACCQCGGEGFRKVLEKLDELTASVHGIKAHLGIKECAAEELRGGGGMERNHHGARPEMEPASLEMVAEGKSRERVLERVPSVLERVSSVLGRVPSVQESVSSMQGGKGRVERGEVRKAGETGEEAAGGASKGEKKERREKKSEGGRPVKARGTRPLPVEVVASHVYKEEKNAATQGVPELVKAPSVRGTPRDLLRVDSGRTSGRRSLSERRLEGDAMTTPGVTARADLSANRIVLSSRGGAGAGEGDGGMFGLGGVFGAVGGAVGGVFSPFGGAVTSVASMPGEGFESFKDWFGNSPASSLDRFAVKAAIPKGNGNRNDGKVGRTAS